MKDIDLSLKGDLQKLSERSEELMAEWSAVYERIPYQEANVLATIAQETGVPAVATSRGTTRSEKSVRLPQLVAAA